MVAILTAWSGYQGAKWGGQQAILYATASTDRLKAEAMSTHAGQVLVADATIFTAWLQAHDAGDTTLEAQLEKRFSTEYAAAFDDWLATDPFTDPDAPAGPAAMPGFTTAEFEQAAALNAQASQALNEGTANRETANEYVRGTVLFASVLFLVAIAQRFTIRQDPVRGERARGAAAALLDRRRHHAPEDLNRFMAERLKDLYGPDVPVRIAGMIADVHPAFPADRFLRDALEGYEDLELTPRARHIADALSATLPDGLRRGGRHRRALARTADRGRRAARSRHGPVPLHAVRVLGRGPRARALGACDAPAARADAAHVVRVLDPRVHRRRVRPDDGAAGRVDARPEPARPPAGLGGDPASTAVGAASPPVRRGPRAGARVARAAEGRPHHARAAERGQQPERHRQGPPRPARGGLPPVEGGGDARAAAADRARAPFGGETRRSAVPWRSSASAPRRRPTSAR